MLPNQNANEYKPLKAHHPANEASEIFCFVWQEEVATTTGSNGAKGPTPISTPKNFD